MFHARTYLIKLFIVHEWVEKWETSRVESIKLVQLDALSHALTDGGRVRLYEDAALMT